MLIFPSSIKVLELTFVNNKLELNRDQGALVEGVQESKYLICSSKIRSPFTKMGKTILRYIIVTDPFGHIKSQHSDQCFRAH